MRSIFFLEIFIALALTGCGTAPAEKAPAKTPPPIAAVHEISADSLSASDDALREYGMGNWDAALARAEDALTLDAENFHALSVKGLITAFRGDPNAGAALIEKALALSPENAQTHYDLALAKKTRRSLRRIDFPFQKSVGNRSAKHLEPLRHRNLLRGQTR